MLIISYNLSSVLKDQLIKVDNLRKKILVIPVSPKTELMLRWHSSFAHLSGWAQLSNQPLNRDDTLKILTSLHTKTTTPLPNKVVNYKLALDYVLQNWTANPEPVTLATILELAKILDVHHGSEKEITTLLTYLQTGDVNPVIQSAMAHLYFYPNRLSYLASLLFLAKYGYDLRGLLSLEDYWNHEKQNYLQVIQKASESATVTVWLEHFCQAVISQMEKILAALNHPIPTVDAQPLAFWRLTDRQKDIVSLVNQPDISITNKKVQSAFKVSQITASRELAKLTSLGIIFPHGAGRSTYYTRI